MGERPRTGLRIFVPSILTPAEMQFLNIAFEFIVGKSPSVSRAAECYPLYRRASYDKMYSNHVFVISKKGRVLEPNRALARACLMAWERSESLPLSRVKQTFDGGVQFRAAKSGSRAMSGTSQSPIWVWLRAQFGND